jgi:hypothetical protein
VRGGDFEAAVSREQRTSDLIQEVNIAGERYLASFVKLPGDHPLRLYSLQSFDQATNFLRSLNLYRRKEALRGVDLNHRPLGYERS